MSSGGYGGHKRVAELAAEGGSHSWRPGEAMKDRVDPDGQRRPSKLAKLSLFWRPTLPLTRPTAPGSGSDHWLADLGPRWHHSAMTMLWLGRYVMERWFLVPSVEHRGFATLIAKMLS